MVLIGVINKIYSLIGNFSNQLGAEKRKNWKPKSGKIGTQESNVSTKGNGAG